jgi:hypothetical protein
MQKYRHGICVFCAKEGLVTDDHIPPQNIFPKPRNNNVGLIAVPACQICNGGSAVDDEEFKLFISLKAGMTSDVGKKLHESTRRTVRHNQKLKRRISDATRIFLPTNAREGFSEFSIVHGDLGPIKRVLRKLVLGLYFHHYGEVICDLADIMVIVSDDIPDDKVEGLRFYCEEIRIHGTLGSIGSDHEFYYRHAKVVDAEYASGWLFAFYQQYGAIAMTYPKGIIEQDAAANP